MKRSTMKLCFIIITCVVAMGCIAAITATILYSQKAHASSSASSNPGTEQDDWQAEPVANDPSSPQDGSSPTDLVPIPPADPVSYEPDVTPPSYFDELDPDTTQNDPTEEIPSIFDEIYSDTTMSEETEEKPSSFTPEELDPFQPDDSTGTLPDDNVGIQTVGRPPLTNHAPGSLGSITVKNSHFNDFYKEVKHGSYAKIASVLANTIETQKKELASISALSDLFTDNMDEDMLVEVVGHSSEGLQQALESTGLRVVNCYKNVCSTYCPVNRLVEISDLEQVNFIKPSLNVPRTGSVTSEGDIAMYADVARMQFNVDGAGGLVCVMSDSYNCLNGAANDVLSGDLPGNVRVIRDMSANECVNGNGFFSSGTDEGRVMLQIVRFIIANRLFAFFQL
jgi:hypothetical protein